MELLTSFGSTIWDYVVPFLVVLTILVFVHEYGHYIVARWNGVRVDVFSVGFGKELFGFTDKSGTRWKFSLLPLGGYVKMHGDADASSSTVDEVAARDSDSFPAKNVLQRMSIIAAGPFANILFAAVVLAFLFAVVGRPFTPPVIGNVEEGSVAALAGLQTYDEVVAVDGDEIDSFEALRTIEQDHADEEIVLTIRRDGETLDFAVTPRLAEHRDERLDQTYRFGELGIGRPFTPADVANVRAGGAADQAGILAGDRIIAVDGEPLPSFEELQRIVSESPGVDFLFTVDRNGETVDLSITPEPLILVRHVEGGAAVEAGFRPGDVITAIDGENVGTIDDLRSIAAVAGEKPLALAIDRGGSALEVTIAPAQLIAMTDESTGPITSLGRIGVERPLPPLKRSGPVQALGEGVAETWRLTTLILGSVWQLISGSGSTDDIGGPIRIAQMTGELSKGGLFPAVMFTVMLSINLGLINLFPIPVLDGGHLVMLFIELVRGKPLNERSQEIAFRFGLALVLSLMVFATWQDLMRFDFGLFDYVRGLVS